MRRIGQIGLALAMCLALALPLFSQATPPPQPAAKTRPEYDAYIAFYNDQNPQTKVAAGEKFLTDYPGSDFTVQSLQLLIQSYGRTSNWTKVMETSDKLVALPDSPFKTQNAVLFALGNAMQAAQQANNFNKIIEYGDKILAIDPNDLTAQLTLSAMIPERLPEAEPARTQALNKAMDLANKAHDQVDAIFKGAKPADIPDAQWAAQQKALNEQTHGTLGLIHYHKGEYDQSIAMYSQVVATNNKDQRAWLLMGIGYGVQTTAAQKLVLGAYEAENAAKAARADQIQIDELAAQRQALDDDFKKKLDTTIDALAKAVAVPDMGMMAAARQELEKYYKVKNNNTTDGIDAFIAQKKAELGS